MKRSNQTSKELPASQPFSVIKFYKEIENKVAELNTYPLSTDNLKIQQDAYSRLGDVSTDWQGDPFAALEFAFKERDDQVRFSLLFFDWGLILAVEYSLEYMISFNDPKLIKLGLSEKEFADQVLAALCMLSNGQIRFWITDYGDYECAAEAILYDKNNKPIVIDTWAHYPWWISMTADEKNYDVKVRRNNFDIPKIDVPKRFIFATETPDYKPLSNGRPLKPNAVAAPLKKPDYAVINDQLIKLWASANMDGTFEKQASFSIYKAWEFWLSLLLFGTILFVLELADKLPNFVLQYPVVTTPIVAFLTYMFIIPMIIRKAYLRKRSPKHPYIVVDDFFHKYFSKILFTVLLTAFIGFSWAPIYILKDQHEFINLLELSTNARWVLLWPAVAILALCFNFWRHRLNQLVVGILTIAALIVPFVADEVVADSSVDTPEPYSTAFMLLMLILLVWGIIKIFKAFKREEVSDKPSSLSDQANSLEVKALFIKKLDIVIRIGSSAALALAGYYFYTDLQTSSLNIGTPASLGFIYGLLALATLVATIKGFFWKKGLGPYLGIAHFFICLVPVIFFLREGADEGAATAFVLTFVAAFAGISATAIYNFLMSRAKDKKILDKLIS